MCRLRRDWCGCRTTFGVTVMVAVVVATVFALNAAFVSFFSLVTSYRSTSPLTLISSQPNLSLSLRVGATSGFVTVILVAYTDATGDEGKDLPRLASLAMPMFGCPLSFDSKVNLRFSTVRQSERFFTRLPLI